MAPSGVQADCGWKSRGIKSEAVLGRRNASLMDRELQRGKLVAALARECDLHRM